MGYIKHNAIIVTGSEEVMDVVFKKAVELFGTKVTKPITGSNFYQTIVVVPDGSKEGWELSNEFDEWRDEFFHWVTHTTYETRYGIDNLSSWLDIIEVRFGGDDPDSEIVRTV